MKSNDQAIWNAAPVVDHFDGDWPQLPVDEALSALVDLIEIHHETGPILEVGCGTGRTHEALMRRVVLRPHGYVGVDLAPAMLERARARYPDADFRAADVLDLPFPPDAFGSVVCADVVQHLRDLDGSLASLLRVSQGHVFLLLRLRKADAAWREPELVDVGCGLSVPRVAYSDGEVIAACRRARGRVLDFLVFDGERDDAGVVRVGGRR